MCNRSPLLKTCFLVILSALFFSGCIRVNEPVKRAVLLKVEDATQADLVNQIDHLAKVNSMYAKMDLKLEDNSYAEQGIAEKYKTADGVVVVQRPASIQLKIQIPIIRTDIVQMTSDGEKFRVAILEDGGSGKYRGFVKGTNDADYSVLQKEVVNQIKSDGDGKELQKNVNAFSNMRPQHFTDAMLVRPVDREHFVYVQSTITQEEIVLTEKKKRPESWVLRGYYLFDEYGKNADGSLQITRRFWFDRVGRVRLARQQIFDADGEIESDIIYGQQGNLTATGEYNNLPLQIEVTRPKEKYKMRLRYQSPETVSIGKTYPPEAFVLENRWNLPEIDLDQKVVEMTGQPPPRIKQMTEMRSQ